MTDAIQRFVVSFGDDADRFDVIVGCRLNDKPLNLADLELSGGVLSGLWRRCSLRGGLVMAMTFIERCSRLLPPPSCRSYSAHKESPAEAEQGLSWKENQDEETGTDTQIAAVLRLGSQGSAPRTRPVAPVAGSRPRRAWDG
jgi:hypothetical protein